MLYKDKSKMSGLYQNSIPVGTHTKIYPDQKVEEIKFSE